MATYNLIRNSVLEAVTSSGTGNKSLTQTELYSLIDSTTTTSGIILTENDVLYLDVDMHQRIQVNGIFIYADDLTKLSNVDFYYKNYREDSYYRCTKSANNTYTATIPIPSAPRYIRCTISGVSMTIYEFSIFNDETNVKFGEDGTADNTWLSHTPLGIYGDPQALEVYNNDSYTVTAYACIDYTGSNDTFVKISSEEFGEYVGLEDNVLIGYDYVSWEGGIFDNVQVNSGGALELIDVGSNVTVAAGWLCQLPLNHCYYRGKPFGVKIGWAYDQVNELIWSVFYTGTNDTNGVCKLYKYIIATNTWVYRCDLVNADFNAKTFAMTCDDVNVYVSMFHSDYVQMQKHDVTGDLGNLTTIGSFYAGGYGTNIRNMAADYKGHVYLILVDYDGSPALFLKYYADGTLAEVMDNHFIQESSNNPASLVYSPFTENLYFCVSKESKLYIQEYVVDIDIWRTSYFNYGDRVGVFNTTLDMFCYNNYLYLSDVSYGDSVYRYDMSNDTVEKKAVPYTASPEVLAKFIVTAPLNTDDDFSLFRVGVLNSDVYYLYGYNTTFENSANIVDIVSTEGTYITPIIALDDPYRSSFFNVYAETTAGLSSISKNADLFDGTIEVRSSDTPMLPVDEIYWTLPVDYSDLDLFKYEVGTQTWKAIKGVGSHTRDAYDTAVCRRTGKIASFWQYYYYSSNYYMQILSRELSVIKSPTSTLRSRDGAGFDGTSSLWWFDDISSELKRVPIDVFTVEYPITGDVYAIAPELNGQDCWVTERSEYSLQLISSAGTLIKRVNLHNPYGCCSTEDLCCWVVQLNDPIEGTAVFKYSRSGDLLMVVALPEACYRMAPDNYGGFYIRADILVGNFYHYDKDGSQTIKISGHPGYDFIKGGSQGFVTYNSTSRRAIYFSKVTGEIIWTLSQADLGFSDNNTQSCPDIFSWDEQSERAFSNGDKSLLPATYDPVWYGYDNLPWREVPKDGYFLPNLSRHQAKITMRSLHGDSSPIVHNISMSPAIKILDIPQKESKPMYVRSSIPGNTDLTSFNVKIKVWWSGKED